MQPTSKNYNTEGEVGGPLFSRFSSPVLMLVMLLGPHVCERHAKGAPLSSQLVCERVKV